MEDNLIFMQMEDTTNFYLKFLKISCKQPQFFSSNKMNIRFDCFVNEMFPNQSTRCQTQAIGIV